MTIKAGDKMPEGAFTRMTADGPQKLTTDQLFAGKTVVLFRCRERSLPPAMPSTYRVLLKLADQIKAKVSTPLPAPPSTTCS